LNNRGRYSAPNVFSVLFDDWRKDRPLRAAGFAISPVADFIEEAVGEGESRLGERHVEFVLLGEQAKLLPFQRVWEEWPQRGPRRGTPPRRTTPLTGCANCSLPSNNVIRTASRTMVTFQRARISLESIAGAKSEFQTVAAPDGNGVCAYPKV